MPKTDFTTLIIGLVFCLSLSSQAYGAISIDGVLDEPEWEQAQLYSDFVTVEPLTGEPAKYSTQVRLLTNAEGIFIGFTNYQPATTRSVNRQFPRDAEIQADRNVVSIDFDGTAQAGYDFTVGSANSQQDGIVTPGDYSADWDGIWYSQTSVEGDYWYSEIHIPWTVAPMTNSADGRKNIGLWFSRVVFDESLRFAFPNAYYSRTTFMEDWQPLEVDQVTSSTMDWFPYISYA
ncbi:carbohydrate binding family 9 domain-containing protein, partial [Porticoccaceae bacterium]|nr:carbohydrate binding family 9 domain-containing protein [Porticoccaceae bacterium]